MATPVLYIYDDIGPDWLGMVSATLVRDELARFGKAEEINVRINSPGGDVFEAAAIYNLLQRHSARIMVDVDGLAASAASYIAMAGDEIRVAANAMMMVHFAWSIVAGNKSELRSAAEVLDRIDDTLIDVYSARTGSSKTRIKSMLEAETWLTASEAVSRGFADEIGASLKTVASASVPAGRFKNTPAHLVAPARRRASLDTLDAQIEQLRRNHSVAAALRS